MAGERVEGAQAVLLDYLDGRNVGCNECHCEECRAKYPHDCRVMRAVAPASAPPQPAPEAKGGARCKTCQGTGGGWREDGGFDPKANCTSCGSSGRATGDREGTR